MAGTSSVEQLLKVKFSTLPLTEKINIKNIGRPTPFINLTRKEVRASEKRSFTRKFSAEIYSKCKWICGCEKTNALFCFPCLLYFKDGMDKTWTRKGFTDLKHMKERIKKHESSRSHMNCCTELALLGKTNIISNLSTAYREQIHKHNQQVEKNRYILKRIINCIKFCGFLELALRGHDESENSHNRGIFRELIDFTSELDSVLKQHLTTATVFKGTSKSIQNDILDSMLMVCRKEIKKEIEESDFLAIQCDETTDVSSHCQMVLIFRYISKGRIYERFWSFLRVEDRSADGLKTLIEMEIDPIILKEPQKLIAQTYDGASVMSGRLGGVQAKIKEKYPLAHFVHCYAHQFNLIMQKSANVNPKIRVFFSDLSGIPAFFSNSSHRSDLLESIVKKRLPRVCTTRWNYNIRTVNTVFENKDKLIECFEEIERTCEKTITCREARGFRRALEDADFLFWLELFHKILPHAEIIFNQFQSRNKDSIQLQKDIETFEKSISTIRNSINQIDVNQNREQNQNIEQITKRRKISMPGDRNEIIAKEVCDTIMIQLKDRLSYRGHLEAAVLLDKDMFSNYSKTFPSSVLKSTVSFYPQLQEAKLKTELELIYMREDFRNVEGAVSLLTFFSDNNLEETFSETTKLLKIIITTPMSTAESERCFSTLKRILTFLRNTMGNDRLNALAMLSINKHFVHNINNFDEKVIEEFISMKERRIDFTYKL